jgi:hypothetical protein
VIERIGEIDMIDVNVEIDPDEVLRQLSASDTVYYSNHSLVEFLNAIFEIAREDEIMDEVTDCLKLHGYDLVG